MQYVEHVNQTYYISEESKIHDGPYFAFIQSSGMGKTKIMYEACQELGKRTGWACQLVLPKGFTSLENENGPVFLKRLDFRVYNKSTLCTARDAATEVFDTLDAVFAKSQDAETLFLCFDETQVYLETERFRMETNANSKEMEEHPAFLFRCIRYWLRQKRSLLQILACFSGTFASLADIRCESDPSINLNSSRDFVLDACVGNQRQFHDKGSTFFDVFVQTTTMGCLKDSVTSPESSEYHRSVRFGRPLFSVFLNDGYLEEKELYILKRMLLSEDDWKKTSHALLFSILGTRVQMGQTTFQIASKLVSKGYANVVSVGDGKAQICFMNDPVCARLAMCMMDEEWRASDGYYCGQRKEWWNGKLQELFSHGICRPYKDDFGESMIALYMLMCGDILRKKASVDYTTFSVDLREWIQLLRFGGADAEPDSLLKEESNLPEGKRRSRVERSRRSPLVANAASNKTEQQKSFASKKRSRHWDTTITVNFIQVTRNYLRGYGFDWAGFFLRGFFEAPL